MPSTRSEQCDSMCYLIILFITVGLLFYIITNNVDKTTHVDNFVMNLNPSWPDVNPFNVTEVYNHALQQMTLLKSPCVVLNYQSSPLEVRQEVIKLFERLSCYNSFYSEFYGKTSKSGYLILQVYNKRNKVDCYKALKELFID